MLNAQKELSALTGCCDYFSHLLIYIYLWSVFIHVYVGPDLLDDLFFKMYFTYLMFIGPCIIVIVEE